MSCKYSKPKPPILNFAGKRFALVCDQIGAAVRDKYILAIRELTRDGEQMAFSVGDYSHARGCSKMLPWVRAARGIDLDGLYCEAWKVLRKWK